MADKERKQLEEAARARAAALADDDNVFDVAYEQQGAEGGADTLSATDIKVRGGLIRPHNIRTQYSRGCWGAREHDR